MKKSGKAIALVFGILILLLLTDTLQARFLDNRSLIKVVEYYDGGSLHQKHEGLLVDTYVFTDGSQETVFRWEGYDYPSSLKPTEIENVTIGIEDVSPTGATVIIKDTNEEPFIYGEWYKIEKKAAGRWRNVKTVIDNYGFNGLGYLIDQLSENKEIKFSIDWEWLYGSLPPGEYRLLKDVDQRYLSVEFEIA